jgi:hypothetical protein
MEEGLPRYNCRARCLCSLCRRKNLDQETIMPKLTSKGRSKLSASQFALPEQKKYPINDKAHARNAKARASEMENEGKISASTKAKIDRASDRVIKKGK